MLTLDHDLTKLVAQRIASGLQRKAISTGSKWATTYRIMGQPFPGLWSFKHHPWSYEMHDCESRMMIGQKAAQMAYTETALNKIFYKMDVDAFSAMYVLPASKPDAADFSSSRFDPALELSPHLTQMFSNVKNVGLKRAGSANLFIRGSRSRNQLKSVPVAIMVFDEVDEMVTENIPLALERTSGQIEKDIRIFLLSTPTIEKYGINEYFIESTQEHYVFQCPHCSRFTTLEPECLIVTGDSLNDPGLKNSHLICKECKAVLNHATKVDWLSGRFDNGTGHWVKDFEHRETRGFQVSQLYSMTVPPHKIAETVIKAQTSPSEEQELFNSKYGLCHTVEGAKLNMKILDACTKDHQKSQSVKRDALVTMGVDVGTWLHYEIDQWFFKGGLPQGDINLAAKCKVVMEGKVKDFEELDQLMIRYGVNFCVIDANPERRKALEFAQRFWSRVRCCFYGKGVTGKVITLKPEDEHTMTVDRTTWLDLSLGRFKRGDISLPCDTSLEYREHVCAPVRVYSMDGDGNPVGKYVTGNEADHFAHSRNYAEMALPLAASNLTSQDVGNIL